MIILINIETILEECKVVNELYKKNYYYCCNIDGVTCSNGHISKMYIILLYC